MKTIVLTGGGTAGHCTPNLALVPKLKSICDKIVYIGTNGIEKTLACEHGLEFYEIPAVKLERKLTLKNLQIPFKLIKSVNKAEKILKQLSPSLIFSKGGYVSLPVILAGSKLKIPCFTHESDLTCGLTTKLIAKKCELVFTTFEQTAKNLKNGVFTGSPLREELFTATKENGLNYFNLSGKKPIVLITGGSSGSKAINDAVASALPLLGKTFDVIHICGKGKPSDLNYDFYRQKEFVLQMGLAYACADVVVSRGGSNTLSELIYLKKPSLIIPLPKNCSRGDQILNAEYYENLGLIKVLQQKNLTGYSLAYNLNKLYEQKQKYLNKLSAFSFSNPNQTICDYLKKYI